MVAWELQVTPSTVRRSCKCGTPHGLPWTVLWSSDPAHLPCVSMGSTPFHSHACPRLHHEFYGTLLLALGPMRKQVSFQNGQFIGKQMAKSPISLLLLTL